MRWKEFLLGAASSLVVTIVAGLILYNLEKPKEKKEVLAYVLDEPTKFDTEKTEIVLDALHVANLGNEAAKDVRITLEFQTEAIIDKKIVFSSGDPEGFKLVGDTRKLLNILVPSLLPGEQIHISLFLAATNTLPPIVAVRSQDTLGIQLVSLVQPVNEKSKIQKGLEFLAPIPIVLLVTIIMLAIVKKYVPRGSGLNNVGFVLLHQGKIDTAEKLLSNAIQTGTDAPHSISNYALCLAAKKDYQEANDYLDAADFYSIRPHEKAVVKLNRCIMALWRNDNPTAYKYLRDALKLSPREIKSYCSYSKLFFEASKSDSEIKRILSGDKNLPNT
jgi:hypothetical protein